MFYARREAYMNWKKLSECVGWRMRLRPIPLRFNQLEALPIEDDIWIVQRVEKQKTVELSNVRTGHLARLGNDHIHHYTSDTISETDGLNHGFLELNIQLIINGVNLKIEPFLSGAARNSSNPSNGTSTSLVSSVEHNKKGIS